MNSLISTNGFCARADASHHELACHICELIGQRSAAASTGGATKVGIAGRGGSHLRASLRTRPHLLAQRLAQHLVVHGGARGRCGALAGIVRSQGGLGAAAAAARSIVSRGQPAVPRRLPAVVFSSCSPGESLTTRSLHSRARYLRSPPRRPARGTGWPQSCARCGAAPAAFKAAAPFAAAIDIGAAGAEGVGLATGAWAGGEGAAGEGPVPRPRENAAAGCLACSLAAAAAELATSRH